MLRTSSVLIAAISLAAAPALAETKKQKKAREAKEAKEAKEKADAEAAAAAEAEAAAAEKAAAEAAAQPDTGGGAGGDAGGGMGDGAALPDAAVAVSGAWPMEFIKRPLTLLQGMIRGQGSLFIERIAAVAAMPPDPAMEGRTGLILGIGAGYGITDKLEAGLNYGLSLNPFDVQGPLEVYGLFSLMHTEKMRIAARAGLGFEAIPDGFGVLAGVAFQYHLGPKMMVFTPPSQIALALDPETTFGITLPVGFGYQATPNIFASVETNLLDIGIKPSGSAFIFADRTPLFITGSYSPSNTLDIGATIGAANIPDFVDVFQFTVFARMFLGKVPSNAPAAVADTAPDMTAPEM